MKLTRNEETFARFLDAIAVGRLVLGGDNQVYSQAWGKLKPRGSVDKTGRERIGLCWAGKNYLTSKTNFVWMWHTRRAIKPEHVIIHRDKNNKNYAFDNLVELHVSSDEAREYIMPRKSSSYKPKLTDENVIAIRKLVTETPALAGSLTELGKKYGVSYPTIKQAILGVTFAHLPGALNTLPVIGNAKKQRAVSVPKPKDPKVQNLNNLTEERVVEIRQVFAASDLSLKDTSDKFQLPRGATHKLLSGVLYPHLPGVIVDLTEVCTRRRNKKTQDQNRERINARRRKKREDSTFISRKIVPGPLSYRQPAAAIQDSLEFHGLPTTEINQEENTVISPRRGKRANRSGLEVRKVTPPNSIAPHREKHFHPRRDWKPRVVRQNSLTEYDLPEGYRVMNYSEVYQRLMAR